LHGDEHPKPIGKPPWILPELVEAAAPSRAPDY
jgi:hypothetical protein